MGERLGGGSGERKEKKTKTTFYAANHERRLTVLFRADPNNLNLKAGRDLLFQELANPTGKLSNWQMIDRAQYSTCMKQGYRSFSWSKLVAPLRKK